jgi:hypothetical protein
MKTFMEAWAEHQAALCKKKYRKANKAGMKRIETRGKVILYKETGIDALKASMLEILRVLAKPDSWTVAQKYVYRTFEEC